MKEREKQLIESFVEGEGGTVANLIDRLSPVRQSQPKNDVFWWLSLMRHYGQPTRLLDFTRDIRMALFFAAMQHCKHRAELQDKNKTKREEDELRSTISSEDLLIYCLPCWHRDDAHSNKTPFQKGQSNGIDMNRALGCAIDLHWMADHSSGFFSTYELKQNSAGHAVQLWGWDRSYYKIPRIEIQKGMLVYPFDDYRSPAGKTTAASESWLIHNLRLSALNMPADPFNVGEHASKLGAKRIRIPGGLAGNLLDHLRHRCQLTSAIAYLDYGRVKLD